MIKSFVTGFPRIGEKRELKFILEKFWTKKAEFSEVLEVANELKKRHYNYQKDIDLVSVNDFCLYDIMLDHIVAFNAIPKRFCHLKDEELYFALARGNSSLHALEMTKWFNTNYHYIVPELSKDTKFSLNSKKFIDELNFAIENRVNLKFNLIGPITFLALSKTIDDSDKFDLLDDLVAEYEKLLGELASIKKDIIIQIEEPIFSTSKGENLVKFIKPVYTKFSSIKDLKILFSTYFEHSTNVIKDVIESGIWGIGQDYVYGKFCEKCLDLIANSNLTLFAGVIDGRNIWKSDISKKLEFISKLKEKINQNRLYVGTSCSLLHVPFSLKYEDNLDENLKNWLSFAIEKLDEITLLRDLLNGVDRSDDLDKNIKANQSRKTSTIVHKKSVRNRVENLTKFQRDLSFEERIKIQRDELKYPILPTTTIGSFPQTTELRQMRNAYKKGLIDSEVYTNHIKDYIKDCVKFQEEIDLDVLVHGEPERNDMVEYFGEMLDGFAFTSNGWVQSYGSRCVKPPLLYADVSRPAAMTVEWITYAQSLTQKIMKGMLTGPVTILNWSFVRDDESKDIVATQVALAIADEINDLQNAGIKIIQVDEAAFKEGYPLRDENIKDYENSSIKAFKLSTSLAFPKTQIHTHMCYSEFNDIIKTIEAMDADVISIETARSGNELLKIFKEAGYKAEVGPGIYDIHSPRIPSVEEMVKQIEAILEVLPKERLWINPDCGLKTRKWEEVKPSLKNLVEATKISRV
ncbi:5-methyltetrahydropteroyltriglutamate--homocysteine S-methyltransferase [Campylobacter sp. FMV-PI01]|uniref:5-methyltetrahydropteroyltriglutamate--homocysteine S-methyltransferase n=1 Tax=Campylobacter portucalensis TaxID=2608384 RepID=A0A6L5WGN9_9BACT|nr:5-methyltetrahydropteroyltriglutamate--homocysteine S-methyltransferase [Campylobacter portucalensis]MSN96340.1 5-methyltetrahydropteroyltriglutamate--homocysteine S-methyltransferase [Campylobacter portucalensis]